jgi:hypothetical protein
MAAAVAKSAEITPTTQPGEEEERRRARLPGTYMNATILKQTFQRQRHPSAASASLSPSDRNAKVNRLMEGSSW